MTKSKMMEWEGDHRKLPKTEKHLQRTEKQNQHAKLSMSHTHTPHGHVAGAQARAQGPDLNPVLHLTRWLCEWAHYSLCLSSLTYKRKIIITVPSSRVTRIGQGYTKMTAGWGDHGSRGLPGWVRPAHRRRPKLRPQGSSLKR